jgi:hypothetical protein
MYPVLCNRPSNPLMGHRANPLMGGLGETTPITDQEVQTLIDTARADERRSEEELRKSKEELKTSPLMLAWIAASTIGGVAGIYHGYKRNHGSILWALGWSTLGSFAPFVTIPLSMAQGYGKPQEKK